MNDKITRTLRETSPPSKTNVTEPNTTQVSVNDNSDTLTITNSLIGEMQLKYPDKDINEAKSSFQNYPHHQNKGWSKLEYNCEK